jgi:two-component system sensor histidine kinase YesM
LHISDPHVYFSDFADTVSIDRLVGQRDNTGMMKKARSVSLKRRITTILLAMLIPLTLALNLYALYINVSYSNRMAELNRVSLAGYVNQVSGTLSLMQEAMNAIVGNNYDFHNLRFKLNHLDAYISAYNVYLTLKVLVNTQPGIAGMVVYSSGNGRFMPAWGSASLNAQLEMREYMDGWRESGTRKAGVWNTEEFAGGHYLCMTLYHNALAANTHNVYLFSFVNLDRMAADSEHHAAFAQDGAYLTSRGLAEENKLPVPGARVMIAGSPLRFMLLSQSIPNTSTEAVFLTATGNIFFGVGPFQLFLLVLSAVMIMLIPLAFWFLKRALFGPMDGLVTAMEVAASGDLSVRAAGNTPDREFQIISATFNDMLDSIGALKIESYERELAARQARLSFLQLQIRPHFYLNCLKNLYGMAQNEQYGKIQEMLVPLGNYLRYMMDCNADLVALSRELSNCRDYILLQQYTQTYPPGLVIDVDDDVTDLKIPPVTLLTFVENCVKHGAMEGRLLITLRGRRLPSESGGVLLLRVKDNGRGFKAEALEGLNRLGETDKEHVGIINVWRRLRLMYGNDCGIIFSNDNGAVAEIFIPIGEGIS